MLSAPASRAQPAPAAGPTTSATAAPAAPAPASPADATDQARRHFRNGVKLYQDTNYAGALAEFEAAYNFKPGPSSLQNMALCQKAMFRYGEAADTVRLLLERHAEELSADEQKAMRAAIEELEGLVGSLVVRVQPPHARVALDGQPIAPEQQGKRLRANVGEHNLVAEAPGYARVSRTLRVASGQQDIPVELALEPNMGFLEVVVDDPRGVIALDGKQLARGRLDATPVTPGAEHLVQVYRESDDSYFQENVKLAVGQRLVVRAALGPAQDGDPEIDLGTGKGGLPPPPESKTGALGWYGVGTLNLLGASSTPLNLDVSNARASSGAVALGVRGGYRFWKLVAGELLLEVGNLAVEDACAPELTADANGECGKSTQISRDFRLSWLRLGPNLRFMSAGEKVRFVAGTGVGAVFHNLVIDPTVDGTMQTVRGYDVSGVDPYFLLELGIGFNFGHWLVEADAIATIDGTSSLRRKLDPEVLDDQGRNTMPIAGLSLRFGYSQWRPR